MKKNFVGASGEEASSLFLEHFLTDSLFSWMGTRRHAVLGWLAVILQRQGGAGPGLKLMSGKEEPGGKGSGVLKDVGELINQHGNLPSHYTFQLWELVNPP